MRRTTGGSMRAVAFCVIVCCLYVPLASYHAAVRRGGTASRPVQFSRYPDAARPPPTLPHDATCAEPGRYGSPDSRRNIVAPGGRHGIVGGMMSHRARGL